MKLKPDILFISLFTVIGVAGGFTFYPIAEAGYKWRIRSAAKTVAAPITNAVPSHICRMGEVPWSDPVAVGGNYYSAAPQLVQWRKCPECGEVFGRYRTAAYCP